jgi:hypothetical protein
MRDPTINLVVKELTEIAIQYLCERELLEASEAVNTAFARSEKLLRSYIWPTCSTRLEWHPPVRKRGRPQQCNHHLQIAGAVALLVEDANLNPTRSHSERRLRSPSACSIVTAALAQLSECLNERTVEGIWDRYRR